MPNNSTPATVVILARLDAATTEEGFGILAEAVRRTGAAVTWVADGATLDRLADGGGEWGWALALDRGAGDSRQGLRQPWSPTGAGSSTAISSSKQGSTPPSSTGSTTSPAATGVRHLKAGPAGASCGDSG